MTLPQSKFGPGLEDWRLIWDLIGLVPRLGRQM